MKYTVANLKYNDFSVFEENKLPKRSYFIPYTQKRDLVNTNCINRRYNSDKVTVLSGDDWSFRYYDDISKLPVVIDTDKTEFDLIKVPSTWQRTGYESPVYLNVRYPFVVSYPTVPEKMSCGVYCKKFNIKEETNHSVITFLGVASNISLFVNGQYVGYSECSHNMTEFSLDNVVHAGENELLVVITKWCNGTYLECQDMFRENGIFRDVYITQHCGSYISDFVTNVVKTNLHEYNLYTDVDIDVKDDSLAVMAELYDGEKMIASSAQNADKSVRFFFGNLQVNEWSAEKPNLYNLYITLIKNSTVTEVVLIKVGFRTVKIEGEKFLFNGKTIKFKGVNHHDTHQSNGYVMTADELKKDVLLMKEFNCNAVRTSHYPPDPVFLDLCDEYGLYVIDEADIETHGTQFDETFPSGKISPANIMKHNRLSNDKKWRPRYLDRVHGLYERDKNHCSVTMWSLGNESGGWKNQDACYEYLKSVSDIPVHYEAVIRTPRGSYDVVSEMYQHPFLLKKIASGSLGKRYNGKPYFLCEYCHAMGVGPGSLEDYWKIIYSSEKLTGGCIWEFADHAFYDPKAKYKYTYGGDHNEERHDGNFCVDGLFFPDRTPHSGAYEMKAVYRPIRSEYISDNIYRFINTNSFVSASEYKVTYELYKNFELYDKGLLDLNIGAGEKNNITIAHKSVDKDNDYHINFIYHDNNDNFIAKEQHILNNVMCKPEIVHSKIEISESVSEYRFVCNDIEITVNKSSGRIVGYTINNSVVINDEQSFMPDIFRAPLDNDRNKVEGWKKSGFADAEFIITKVSKPEFTDFDSKVKLKVEGKFVSDGKKLFNCSFKYTIYGDGTVKVKSSIMKKNSLGSPVELPKFGMSVRLDKSLRNVSYEGRGDNDGLGECLSDFKEHSLLGKYNSTVECMNQSYIKPQENGTHCDTKQIDIYGESGYGISVIASKKPFVFNIYDYSNDSLRKALHIEDVTESSFVTLNIDGYVRGAGSNSCGPDVLSEYKVILKDKLSFGFYLRPFKINN